MKNWFFSLSRAKQIVVSVLWGHGFILLFLVVQNWMSYIPPKRKHIAINTVRVVPPPKQVVAPAPVKAAAPKKTVVTKKKAAVKPELLKEIQKGLAAVSAPVKVVKSEIEVPVLKEADEVSPAEIIGTFLQEMLQLPEFGEVKVHLVLDRFGKLETLEIVEAKSEKNAEFLRNQLPQLLFPCLNKGVNLTIVFSNAV